MVSIDTASASASANRFNVVEAAVLTATFSVFARAVARWNQSAHRSFRLCADPEGLPSLEPRDLALPGRPGKRVSNKHPSVATPYHISIPPHLGSTPSTILRLSQLAPPVASTSTARIRQPSTQHQLRTANARDDGRALTTQSRISRQDPQVL